MFHVCFTKKQQGLYINDIQALFFISVGDRELNPGPQDYGSRLRKKSMTIRFSSNFKYL